MSLGLWPDAVPFDPGSGTASHDMKSHLNAAALPEALLLVTEPGTAAWAGQAAVAVARALGEPDRRVVLVDVHVAAPALHEVLGEPNGEGIADVVLFGASLERVTLRPAGEPFDFVPAGAFAPDPAAVLDSDAWLRLLALIHADGATLLAFVRTDTAGLDALAARIPSVMVLADPERMTAVVAHLPESIVVHGVIRPALAVPVDAEATGGGGEPAPAPGPAAIAPADAPATDPDAAPADEPPGAVPVVLAGQETPAAPAAAEPAEAEDAIGRAMIADLEHRQRSAVDAPVALPFDRELVGAAVPDGTGKRSSLAPWLITAVVVVILAAGAVVFGPGFMGPQPATVAAGPAGPAAATALPRAEVLAWSVAIESLESFPEAALRADSLTAAVPGTLFSVAPIRVDGTTFYRILAGPLPDSASAAAAMQALVDRGLKIAPTPWDVRNTPLAFAIESHGDRAQADARVAELRALGVPGYVIEVPYTDGATRHQIYAGAYSAPSEAEAMRELLRTHVLPDTLVVRVGRISS